MLRRGCVCCIVVLLVAGPSASAQIPPVPTIAPETLPQQLPVPELPAPDLPVPAPEVPDVPLPAPDLPAAPAPVPDLPDPPARLLPGSGDAASGESGAAPSGGSGGNGGGGGATAAATAGASSASGRSAAAAGAGRKAAPRRTARATAGPTPRQERRLRRMVERLRACLDAIGSAQRRVLVLRAGLGAAAPHSRAAVADRLHTSVRAVRRTERRGLRSLRASARDGCGGTAGAAPGATAFVPAAYDLDADRDALRGDGATGTVTGRAGEPGQGGVMDEFRTGPGGVPGATLTPPSPGDGGPPLLALIAIGFLAGFALVWAVERRRVR